LVKKVVVKFYIGDVSLESFISLEVGGEASDVLGGAGPLTPLAPALYAEQNE